MSATTPAGDVPADARPSAADGVAEPGDANTNADTATAPADAAPPRLPNGVVDALYKLQNAEALHESRLRERLHIGASELSALRLISRLTVLGQDARSVDIAQSLGVTSGAASGIVAHLIARGYLTRTANPRDGRGSLLHLTPAASSSMSGALDDSQSVLSQLVSGLSLREARRLVLLLTAVTSSLDAASPPA